MSTRRIAMITTIPQPIKRAFHIALPPVSGDEKVWREKAARMTLDALGHTNLTTKPQEHNNTVRYSRRWFRRLFDDDDSLPVFDLANIDFKTVRDAVLNTKPIIFEPEDDEEEID